MMDEQHFYPGWYKDPEHEKNVAKNDLDKKRAFDNVAALITSTNNLIELAEKRADHVDIETEIPNIGTTMNNKLRFIVCELENAGVPYSSFNSVIGESSRLGMMQHVNGALEAMEMYFGIFEHAINRRPKALVETSKVKRFFSKLRSFFGIKEKTSNFSIGKFMSEDEIEDAVSCLKEYKYHDDNMWNADLKELLKIGVPVYAKNSKWSEYNASGLIDDVVAPDLKKLGIADILPVIKEKAVEECKKNEEDEKDIWSLFSKVDKEKFEEYINVVTDNNTFGNEIKVNKEGMEKIEKARQDFIAKGEVPTTNPKPETNKGTDR